MKKKIAYNENGGVYKPADVDAVLTISVCKANLKGNSKGIYYYNIPISFDIETTSFYRDETGTQYTYEQYKKLNEGRAGKVELEKVATMYVWQFGINGNVIVGRTWDEFVSVTQRFRDVLELDEKHRAVVFVHNLSYEFQFIRGLFEWEKVFSIDLRKPIYAITKGYIEFRCSYLLSGYGLAKLGSQLLTYKVDKMVGDLDYSLMRNSRTPLTDKEMGYCVNDVKVVMAYIQERIDEVKGLPNLPLTKTGYVRKYCRKECLYYRDAVGKKQQNFKYTDLMKRLQISGVDEFSALQRAFAGGFTHANARYTNEIRENVASYDFTSSYPYVMVSEMFPMSRGIRVSVTGSAQFRYYIDTYCCVFDVTFHGLKCTETQDNPISVSKCWEKENVVDNNGRVVCADMVTVTITNLDYDVYRKFYRWESMEVGTMYCYRREYLPTEFVKSILHLYEKKTTLKGVKGMELEYLNSKEMLNSCYGMAVTNPLRDEFVYDGEWDINKVTPQQCAGLLDKYNTSRNRFLFYPWGVFVTAYARRNLFTAIYEAKQDYIYSDTDSIKLMNADKHKAYFDRYNRHVVQKLRMACKYHGIDFAKCAPKTIKGKEKMLGVWDYEGTYERFKTLGAKRYMVKEPASLTVGGVDYGYSLTVSGVNKNKAIPWLVNEYGDSIMDHFRDGLYLPTDATGKNIHTYIDYEQTGELTDYMGNVARFRESGGIHLEPTDYRLSLSVLYLKYLTGIRLKSQ